MLEKPALADDQIAAALRAAYGIAVAGLDFLPVGRDANAWVYRVTASDGARTFLKVRRGALNAPGLLIPRFLKDQGLASIVAPLRAADARPWAELDDFKLILYPYLEADTGYAVGLSDAQWIEFGATLKRLHATRLPADLAAQMRVETFVSRHVPLVRALDARIAAGDFDADGPVPARVGRLLANAAPDDRLAAPAHRGVERGTSRPAHDAGRLPCGHPHP